MEEQDLLFEYIEKIKGAFEYLARGNEIETMEYTVINLDRNTALQEGAISIEEVELWDTLQCSYYNELRSVQRVIEVINETSPESFEAEIMENVSKPFDSKEAPKKFVKEYNAINKRLKAVLNSIVIKLYMGLKVKLTEIEAEFIKTNYSAAKDDESEFDNEVENDEEFYGEFDDEEEEIAEDVAEPYMIYSPTQKCFYVMRDEEIIVENVDVPYAMARILDELYYTDRKRQMKELESGQTQKSGLEYSGMHIFINEDQGKSSESDKGHEEL